MHATHLLIDCLEASGVPTVRQDTTAPERKPVVETVKESAAAGLQHWLRRVLNGVVDPMGLARQNAMLLLHLAVVAYLSSCLPLTAAMKSKGFFQSFSREGVCAVTVGSRDERYAGARVCVFLSRHRFVADCFVLLRVDAFGWAFAASGRS